MALPRWPPCARPRRRCHSTRPGPTSRQASRGSCHERSASTPPPGTRVPGRSRRASRHGLANMPRHYRPSPTSPRPRASSLRRRSRALAAATTSWRPRVWCSRAQPSLGRTPEDCRRLGGSSRRQGPPPASCARRPQERWPSRVRSTSKTLLLPPRRESLSRCRRPAWRRVPAGRPHTRGVPIRGRPRDSACDRYRRRGARPRPCARRVSRRERAVETRRARARGHRRPGCRRRTDRPGEPVPDARTDARYNRLDGSDPGANRVARHTSAPGDAPRPGRRFLRTARRRR